MNVGSTVGEQVYSIDRISYLDGDATKNVDVAEGQGNEFNVIVYKEAPTVERENYQLDKNTISIDLNITDIDTVIEADSLYAKLFSGETLKDEVLITTGLTNVEFDNLDSNKLYEVKVVASYDLADSTGAKTDVVLYSGTYATLANGLPSASFQNVEVSSNSVEFDVDFTDEDAVVTDGGLRVAIYNGETMIGTAINITGATTGLEFDTLLNDSEYTLKVIGDYNLLDGSGISTDKVLAEYVFNTLPRQVPEPTLDDLILLENEISFEVVIDDPNGIIDENTLVAKLYIEDMLVDTAEIGDYEVSFQVVNLFSNHEFKIEIIADYDLNDGKGVQAEKTIYSSVFNTEENARPSVDVSTFLVEQGYVTVNLGVSDTSETLVGALEAVLYEGCTLAEIEADDTCSAVEVQSIMFDETASQLVFDYPTEAGRSYYVEFYADYNLRDNQGQFTMYQWDV
jgi:hypothetical protein